MPLHRSNLATLSQAIFHCLQAMGHDAADMYRRAGLDSALIHDVNARFGVSQNNRLWRIAFEETQRPCLMYDVVGYIEPWMLQAMGYSWISSQSLLSALQRLVRYHRMLSTNMEIELEQMQGAWQLRAKFTEQEDNPAPDAVVILVLHMCRMSFGEDLVPLEAQLARSKPEDASAIEDFFRCNVEYDCSENTLVFSTTDLNRLSKSANPNIVVAMDDVIVAYLAQLDTKDIVSQVRQVVAHCLIHGEPDKQFIAEELNLAPRTLQRRLEEQQSSIKEIVDETRHHLALDYLDQKHSSIKEIAYALGYSDPSNFSRSFKRWEGKTPKEYRRSIANG